ncbi:hypothetical protein [Stenotrophomonas sp. 24(2023)]|uniref:hypothetical protein n=1 Tax=Stenotrophomonas sp. 24(2023) TaxID=3068324 RepID=UPI0027DF7E3D|nr:hypothetical protein [Stenotrophomonas sp. 24(2023)]WMJ69690.1 hypothetical protein Q9R17_00850 [Stenotrophomonas sp. 24(2023)]
MAVILGRSSVGWLLMGLLCSGMAAVACTALGHFAIPRFAASFAEAGQSLPAITRWFGATYALAWVGPPLVVATWLMGRARFSALIGSASLMVATPIAMFATYLPVFRLGSLV